MKLTEAEWSILEILWKGERFSLKEITDSLYPVRKWSKNTVHTYLTRMSEKGLVLVDRSCQKPYGAAVSRDECVGEERSRLLNKAYGGHTGDLIAAFLKDSPISRKEVERLKSMLDNMEV